MLPAGHPFLARELERRQHVRAKELAKEDKKTLVVGKKGKAGPKGKASAKAKVVAENGEGDNEEDKLPEKEGGRWEVQHQQLAESSAFAVLSKVV